MSCLYIRKFIYVKHFKLNTLVIKVIFRSPENLYNFDSQSCILTCQLIEIFLEKNTVLTYYIQMPYFYAP